MKTNIRKDDKLCKIGVLGCGTISQAAHLIGCSKARNIQLEAICDVAEDLRNKMAAMYDPKKVYDSFDKMLADPEIDAVIIGIADQFHVPCAKQALKAGKHVFVEKPMGVSIEECNELKALVERTGLLLQVGNMKRFDEGLQFAKQFKEEKLGEVTTYKGWYCDSVGRYTLTDNVMPILYSSDQMKKPAGNPKAIRDRYYLLGHGSHLFDTARFFMGDIISVEAKYKNIGNMHSWLIACDFASGAIGNLDLTIAIAQEWHEGVQIYGTKGTIFAKTFNPWEMRSSIVECYDGETDTIIRPAAYDGQFYRRQLEAFADSILNKKPVAGANVEDGTQAIRALVATYESVQAGGKRIYLKDVQGGL